MNARAVLATLRPGTGGRGPIAAMSARPLCQPATPAHLPRATGLGPVRAPRLRLPRPAGPQRRSAPPRSPPRAGTPCSFPPASFPAPALQPWRVSLPWNPVPSPGRHGPPSQRRGWGGVGAVGHTPRPVAAASVRLRQETPRSRLSPPPARPCGAAIAPGTPAGPPATEVKQDGALPSRG